ncbi:MAG: hypothetical protein ABII00_16820 [Elusimicrobiota bacterium]
MTDLMVLASVLASITALVTLWRLCHQHDEMMQWEQATVKILRAEVEKMHNKLDQIISRQKAPPKQDRDVEWKD